MQIFVAEIDRTNIFWGDGPENTIYEGVGAGAGAGVRVKNLNVVKGPYIFYSYSFSCS